MISRLTLLAAVGLLSASTAVAQDGRVSIQMDHAQRIQLGGSATSVIVANPQIADVTVVDANTLYVLGKGIGMTDVVALDAAGRTLLHRQIVVNGGGQGSAVRMWRGARRTEMACADSCVENTRVNADAPVIATPAP